MLPVLPARQRRSAFHFQSEQYGERVERRLDEAVLDVEGFRLVIECVTNQRADADQLCCLHRAQDCILEQAAADPTASLPQNPNTRPTV